MTREQYLDLCQQHPYYKGRWGYYAAATEILEREAPAAADVLEIGPAMVPLVSGSQLMRLDKPSPHVKAAAPTYVWDVRQTPWPIGDKRYAAAAALQVWEHLDGRQPAAFAELRRVARFAVLSFPYKWNCPNDPLHHAIGDDQIAAWTLAHPMRDRLIVPDDDVPKLLRLVCSFEFGG
jgi:hypothetical protein